MATRARPTQGVELSVRTADGTPVTSLASISKATQAVVGKTGHGLTSGTIGRVSGAGGMVEINGTSAMIEVIDADSFRLLGVDSTGYTTYTSGGVFTPYTMTNCCEITAFNPSDPGVQLLEVSTICSTAKEFLSGLPDDGTASLTFNYVMTDTALERLWTLRDAGTTEWFRVEVPATEDDTDTWYVSGKALVQAMSKWPNISVNQSMQGNGSLKFSGGTYQLSVAA
jgi:hypothetical protein